MEVNSQNNRHESYEDYSVIKTSSDRAFGLTVGLILLAFALARAVFFDSDATITNFIAGVGALLVLFGIIRPQSLSLLNRLWTQLGLLLAKIVNPIVMGLMYFILFVPIGLVMKIFGRDLLRQKPDAQQSTYWVERDVSDADPQTMKNQF